MNAPPENFERRAREIYREASQHVDPVTAGRLRTARREALASSAHAAKHRAGRWLIPSSAFAMLALAALMVWQPLPHRAATPSAHVAAATQTNADIDNDLPPDADQTDPNLYQDLDFYGWLAANDNQPARR
jgi:hypothetical protein